MSAVDNSELTQMRANSQRNRIQFLEMDLDLCFTFANIASTELETMHDEGGAARALASAEQGYATIARFLPEVEDEEKHGQFQQKLEVLRVRLDRLQRQMEGAA